MAEIAENAEEWASRELTRMNTNQRDGKKKPMEQEQEVDKARTKPT